MPFEFDPRFRSLTLPLLRQLPENELAHAVQDHVFIRIGSDPEREKEIVAALPEAVRGVHAALILDAQVKNGGFNQFFWNAAHWADTALQALAVLGATEHAGLLQEAMDLAVDQMSHLLPYHVEGSVEAFSASYKEGVFEALDVRYYGLPDLDRILSRAIREHPERFCSP